MYKTTGLLFQLAHFKVDSAYQPTEVCSITSYKTTVSVCHYFFFYVLEWSGTGPTKAEATKWSIVPAPDDDDDE
jgi:hypothetical protein